MKANGGTWRVKVDEGQLMGVDKGRFQFSTKFRKISVGNQIERTISVWSYQNIWDIFEGGRSTLKGPVISVGWTEMSLSIWQIVVLTTAPLYPACKNDKETRGGLGRVCVTVMYPSLLARRISDVSNGDFCWMKSAQGEWKLIGVNEVEEGERSKIIKSRIKANQGVWRRTKVYIR